ncbi:hypothetical protein RN22_14575 [Grimontia sp. AD028]|uniref:hypothetical protein n=1 Tax=Grimontia sp. AD028 TaxID=1581149 RepID=UPI00061AA0DE|nr:hypothetical protein [Grimontia sp. AD028]KKD59669.1 hypothetical protein RN22_14575 [Grimontia sp. AD028]
MSSKYFRCIWEGEESDGFYYSEVINGEITRQIVEIDGDLKWSTLLEEKDECYMFTDQPEVREEDIEYSKENLDGIELTREQFEEIWLASKQ